MIKYRSISQPSPVN